MNSSISPLSPLSSISTPPPKKDTKCPNVGEKRMKRIDGDNNEKSAKRRLFENDVKN